MTYYECKICNLKTHIKTHLKTHMNTKKHKKNITLLDDNQKNIGNNLSSDHLVTISEQKSDHLETNLRPFSDPKVTISDKKNKFFCKFCDSTFKYKTHLYRHMRTSCKNKKENDRIDKLEKLILSQEEKHKKALEENKKEKEKLYKYIEKLIDKSCGDTIHIGDQQTNQQTNQQINLNSFGSEDMSHITDSFKTKMLNVPYGMVQKFVEKVHFSKKKPENKNIAITNKKDKMIKVFKNKKWKYQNKAEVLDELIKINYVRLDDYYENGGKEQLDKFNNNKYMNFQNKFDKEDDDLMEKITNECEMIIMSDNL